MRKCGGADGSLTVVNGSIIFCCVSVRGEALRLFFAETLRLVGLLGLVEALVNEMEETSAEATNVGTNCVAPYLPPRMLLVYIC